MSTEKCACQECLNLAEQTEYSPYMDDFCGDCTMRRCDAEGRHVQSEKPITVIEWHQLGHWQDQTECAVGHPPITNDEAGDLMQRREMWGINHG